MICFKVIEGILPRFLVLGSQKRNKKHGQIRVKLFFIKYDDKFCRVLSNFCRFKLYNISTANINKQSEKPNNSILPSVILSCTQNILK